MATYTLLTNDKIEAVLKLQSQNLKHNLSEDERASQGFLTISHDKDIISDMNSKVPGIMLWTEKKAFLRALPCILNFMINDRAALDKATEYTKYYNVQLISPLKRLLIILPGQ